MGAWLKTHRSIAASILLMAMVGCLSLGLMHHVHRLEEADCFQRLQEAAVSLADEILLRVESDQQQLSLIAETIATQDGLDHSAAVRILRRYHSQGMMTPAANSPSGGHTAAEQRGPDGRLRAPLL